MMNNSIISGLENKYTNISKSIKASTPPTQTPQVANSTQPMSFDNIMPTAGVKKRLGELGSLTVDFGGHTKFEKFHPGVDIANAIGTPIKAFTPGVVSAVVLGNKQGDKGYGNQVIISDNAGNQQKYNHLSNSQLKVGQKINAGDILGQMGNSGSTYSNSGGTGSHLDYRVWNTFRKQYVNPYSYLKSYYG